MTPPTTPADHRAARRTRTNRMRRGVATGALTLFVGVWAGLSTQLAAHGATASTSRAATSTAVTQSTTTAAVAVATAQAVAPAAVTTSAS